MSAPKKAGSVVGKDKAAIAGNGRFLHVRLSTARLMAKIEGA
jgi:hypothetical protein